MPLEIDLFAYARGSVMAPAGCGKTQLIADTLGQYTEAKPVLILTHTVAGKAALEARLTRAQVGRAKYRVSTIDSWSIRLISKFPMRSGHRTGITDLRDTKNDYPAIRQAANNLLSLRHVSDVLRATYSRVIVDEYQDCTVVQHNIIAWLAQDLPTYVLGDPLQAIFGFNEPTVHWVNDVQVHFPALGELSTPWRWHNAGTHALGKWLLDARAPLMGGQALDLSGAPPEVVWVKLDRDINTTVQQRMQAARTPPPNTGGSVLILGDSTSPQGQRLVASQTPGATAVDAVDMRDLMEFGRNFDPTKAASLNSLVQIAGQMMTNLGAGELLRRLEILERGSARKEASPAELACLQFRAAPSATSALAALKALEAGDSVRVYRPEALHICKAALQEASEGVHAFAEAVLRARERRRHLGRHVTKRAVGSTLLLKGLEADVVVILNPGEMDAKHLYVALTRGSRKVVVCSTTPKLIPARR